MGELLENISSAGLRPAEILSAVLDKELDLDLSTLAFFFLIFLLLSILASQVSLEEEFAGGGEDGVTRNEESERGLLCGSLNEEIFSDM
jgi:hypothetical protein